MTDQAFSSFGIIFVIANIISNKVISWVDYIISSLYRIFIIQYTIPDKHNDTTYSEGIIKYIIKNRVKVQLPMYQVLNDENDINKKNKIKGKKLELDSGYYSFRYKGAILFAQVTTSQDIMTILTLSLGNNVAKKDIKLMTFFWNNRKLIDFLNSMTDPAKKGGPKQESPLDSLMNGRMPGFTDNCATPSSDEPKEKEEHENFLMVLSSPSSDFVSVNDSWIKFTKLENKSMDTIVLPQIIKNQIFDDYTRFTSEETKKTFQHLSIHYKRSYLLYGKPGGGKTSFVRAFATKFNMNIYEFNPSFHNVNVMRMKLNQIPNNSILLLEDIDVLFPNREQLATELNNIKDENVKSAKEKNIRDISNNMNKFFNIFDGVINTLNGCIIFFTTNYIDKLDPAITRAGRCDVKVEFPALTHECAHGVIRLFYPDVVEEELAQVDDYVVEGVMPCELSEFMKQNVGDSWSILVDKMKGRFLTR